MTQDRENPQDTTNSSDPNDFAALDPAEFVGEPPAGEDDPGAVMSNDQSADPTDRRTEEDS